MQANVDNKCSSQQLTAKVSRQFFRIQEQTSGHRKGCPHFPQKERMAEAGASFGNCVPTGCPVSIEDDDSALTYTRGQGEIRILIIGASGSGKSTVGNILLGENYFKVSSAITFKSQTKEARIGERTRYGRHLKVLDTPDIGSHEFKDDARAKEVSNWQTMCPEPHLILLTICCVPLDLNADVLRFRRFKQFCGADFIRSRLVMLFTREDKLEESIEDFKKRTHSVLKEIWREADARHLFLGAREHETLVGQVFQMCDELTKAKEDFIERKEKFRSCDGFFDCTPKVNKQEKTFMQNGHTKDVLKHELKVLIIGKTGNGKSSVGNSILNTGTFPVTRGLASSAKTDLDGTTQKLGVAITVTDTPDVSNLPIDEEAANQRIRKWKSYDPDVILLAIRCDQRYTAEEHLIYQQIQKVLGQEYVKPRLTVAFTFGDRQDRDIKEELKTVCKELMQVLKDAGGRYIVFSNKDTDEDKKRQAIYLMNPVPNLEFPSTLKRILLFGSTARAKILGGNALVRRKVFKADSKMLKLHN